MIKNMDIKSYPEKPFKEALDEMNVNSVMDRENFLTTISHFAEQCYNMGVNQNLKPMEELEGYFNWRAIESEKYLKIYFSYYHSEDILISVNGYDELSREEYIESYGISDDEDCDCNKTVNIDEDLKETE
jgi:hypothetical protein